MIRIWTDGACSGNPGRGGYAAYIQFNSTSKAVCGHEAYTTNNRMELNGFLAGIVAAREISPMIPITIYTDSKYIENAINCGWLNKWVRKNFKGIKNSDLWLQIEPLVRSLNISVVWVKGHSSSLENNIADRFACEARDGLHGKSSIIYF